MRWTLGCCVGLHSDLSPFKAALNQTSEAPYYTACKKRLMVLLREHFCIYCAGLPLFFYIKVLDGRVALVSFMTGYSKNTVERCSTLKGLLCEWPQGVLLSHVPHSLLWYWKQRPEYSLKHLLCSTDKIRSKTMWEWVKDDWIACFFWLNLS